jgi:Ni,Fe-hydrogenase I large subunit
MQSRHCYRLMVFSRAVVVSYTSMWKHVWHCRHLAGMRMCSCIQHHKAFVRDREVCNDLIKWPASSRMEYPSMNQRGLKVFLPQEKLFFFIPES